jgi:hypothetical protein
VTEENEARLCSALEKLATAFAEIALVYEREHPAPGPVEPAIVFTPGEPSPEPQTRAAYNEMPEGKGRYQTLIEAVRKSNSQA